MSFLLAVCALTACGDDDGTVNPDAGPRTDGGGGNTDAGPPPGDSGPPPIDWLDPMYANREVDPMLPMATNLTAPVFMPAAASPAAMMAGMPPAPLEAAMYVGAIEPGGDDWTVGWTDYPADGNPSETMAAGCADPATGPVVMVTADIAAATTWSCDNIYVLAAPIYVSAVLTIEAGTIIRGGDGANALIITTAGRLEAVGTPTAPIVFTSSKTTDRAAGDWGGVVLLGTAPINVAGGTTAIEGLDPGEARGEYGGTNAAHDCGTLQYVRIEYAGFVFGDDNELNGLTLGGCGTGTTLDHIQVHLGLDDGIEFFGGTAGLSHAVVTQVGDDGLDWDQGWSGNAQFLIVQQSTVGNRAFESDNLADANDSMPRSNPRVWNVTLVGGGQMDQQAMRLKEGTAGNIGNVIGINFGMSACVTVQHEATIMQASNGMLSVRNSIFNGCGSAGVFAFSP